MRLFLLELFQFLIHHYRYAANFCCTCVLLSICTPAAAQAEAPSYVGDWSALIYDYSWYYNKTEDQLIAELEARINASAYRQSLKMCGEYKLLKNAGDWADLPSPKVAGVTTKAVRHYGAQYYDRTGDGNGNLICVTHISTSSHTFERWRLVCEPRTIFANGKCVSLTEEPPLRDANNGKSCPFCGQPINPSTGNMWHVEEDYASTAGVRPLGFKRTYNSSPLMPSMRGGILGQGWSNEFDVRLEQSPLLPDYSRIRCWIRSDNQERICPVLTLPTLALPTAITVYRADGKSHTFQKKDGYEWLAQSDVNDKLKAVFNTDKTAVLKWEYVTGDGNTTEHFDFNGLRTLVSYAKGGTQRFTYSTAAGNDTTLSRYPADAPICNTTSISPIAGANRLLCVTDHWGRQLHFKYDQLGRLAEMIDPEGQSTIYEYDGESAGCSATTPQSLACSGSVLTKVTYPGGMYRQYIYNEVEKINAGKACMNGTATEAGRAHLPRALTGLVDEKGVRFITWTYNCDGRATSSQLAGGVEKVNLAYSVSTSQIQATVTHEIGDPASPQTTEARFYADKKLGVFRNTSVSGRCVECGSISSRGYDARGNVTSTNHFDGTTTFYSYDAVRNLEILRTEGWGYSDALLFNTAWHPIFRLPLKISEPKRLLTFTYDDRGNQLTLTEQATTDPLGIAGFAAVLTGVPRTWTTTYNDAGQITSVRGPRADVLDLTRYDYDTMGNLSMITNAAGHRTTLSNYDAHGHVGRIEAPNGAKTTFTYTPRGLLESSVLDDGSTLESTNYSYDNAGHLSKVTMPNGAWISYNYDSAQRLTGIVDNIGNTMTYTLDLRGNRLREQVNDSGGNLRRQVTRVFDTLNRVRQQTGGVQ